KYDRDVLIMETGYNWTENKKNGYGGQLTPTEDDPKNAEGYEEKYPFKPAGQLDFLADLFDALKSVDNGRCAGVLYWDPCMIHVEDPDNPNESLSGWAYNESDDKPAGNVVENTTLFDFDGKALPAFEAFMGLRPDRNKYIAVYYDDNNNVIDVKNAGAPPDSKRVKVYAWNGEELNFYGKNW
ncbi:MAG: glycosyl hydrolase 53 family protein, partial [Clostridia bacterium]|nr:glycosyl hydrolase 53 family protein [Clostridia bacterium]